MGDFEIDAVLQFMLSKGGRVRNHELVTHFKNVLNHPVNKALNREKFKDYVNELASIKLDAGEKVLVLKRKYRPGSMYGDSTNSSSSSSASLSLSNSSSYLSKSSGSKPSFSNTTAASEPNLTPPETSMERPPEQNVSARAQSEPPSATPSDSTDGPMMSKIKDEHMPVNLSKTDRVTEQKKIFEDSVSVSGSNVSLASTESQRSATSSTSGVTSTDDDPNASVISVRDKIKNLNKISSEVDLQQPVGNRKNNKYTKQGVDDDDMSHASGVSYVTLTPEQRDWMVVSAASDYHDMNRLLSKNPSLAKLKNFTNGYTALHWAAKNGKMEVIKLIANKPGVKVNQRSHGGYTPLHLAAIHDHEYIIELLVQTFKADPNIRDYSGKKAKQYLKNSASSKAQLSSRTSYYGARPKSFHASQHLQTSELLASKRLGSELRDQNMDDSFVRSSTRMSNRAKAVSSMLMFKSESARQLLRSSWNGSGSSENLRTPPDSTDSSPKSFRKKDLDLMPPPSNAMMGRRTRRNDRSKSSSRESSPRSGRKNDINQNVTKASSDSNLPTSESVIM